MKRGRTDFRGQSDPVVNELQMAAAYAAMDVEAEAAAARVDGAIVGSDDDTSSDDDDTSSDDSDDSDD
eukprot:CAMPEP_0194336706 /NCGR_PEP_ID=MMETSP0171-20130528/73891_1 /TAXON_ID=218684 /ORGANISM="Corethron pennatum, Strain L29A3" /LENGTH=67 /DNA_ID=CAMNT_0039100247 /DNA_START=15 /DNA_END=215 /DNA_ORIENTATION=+